MHLRKKIYKYKFLISVIITLSVTMAMCIFLTNKISEQILVASEKKIRYETTIIFKKAFSNLNFDDKTNDIISVYLNEKKEILGADFKIDKCYELMNNIIKEIDQKLLNSVLNNPIDYVPLGYITNSPLFINLGPKIPVKINLLNSALGNINTTIKPYGINNSLIEIYLEINIALVINSPIEKNEMHIPFNILLSSKLIEGTVPNYYPGYINKESEIFSLPLNEKL